MLNRKAESMKIDSELQPKAKLQLSPERRSLLNDFKKIERRDSMEPHSAFVINHPPPGRTIYSSGELDNQSTVGFTDEKTSFLSNQTQKPIVKEFYGRIEQILINSALSDYGRSTDLKALIYKCLDDIIIDHEQVKIEERIGRGSSSEVFAGHYLFSPIAVKRLKIDDYSEKQLVGLRDAVPDLQRDKLPEEGAPPQHLDVHGRRDGRFFEPAPAD